MVAVVEEEDTVVDTTHEAAAAVAAAVASARLLLAATGNEARGLPEEDMMDLMETATAGEVVDLTRRWITPFPDMRRPAAIVNGSHDSRRCEINVTGPLRP
jgi:hypothetical protein